MSHIESVYRNTATNGTNCCTPSQLQAESDFGSPWDQVFAFVDLLHAYQPYGGLSRTKGLPTGGHVRCCGRDRLVDELVVQGKLIAFKWSDTDWMPMFQFDQLGLEVEPKTQAVMATLGLGCKGWALANWFVQPNPWLESNIPIDCLESRLSDVLFAANAYHASAIG